MIQVLKIRDLSILVRLGCTVEERTIPQEIRVTAELRFAHQPLGALTDRLEDTHCYAELCAALHSYTEKREFVLLEKLTTELFDEVRRWVVPRGQYQGDGSFAEPTQIALDVCKVAPPIPGLRGGVSCRIGDFL